MRAVAGALAQSATLKGMAWMLGSTLCLSAMQVMIRLGTEELHPFVLVFWRNLFGVVVLAPLVLRYGIAPLRTKRPGLLGARAATNLCAMLLFFYALTIAPLAQVTALGFSFPIFLALLAVPILGEKIGPRRWLAILAGFGGVLVIVRPGFQAVSAGDLMTLASAAMWAVTVIIIKTLSRTESSLTITAYMAIMMAVLSLPIALSVWSWPSAWMWLLLLAIGLSGTVGQWMLTESLRLADTSVVTPIDYLRLVWVAVMGYALFGEVPDEAVWLGGFTIVASATYIAYRERHAGGGAGTRPGGAP